MVITNSHSGIQQATAERVDLSPLIDGCVVTATIGIRKPNPRTFGLAAKRCGQTTSGAWMTGDAETNMLGATRAEMHSAWFARERTRTRENFLPDVIATRPTEALHAVNDPNAQAKPRPFFLPFTKP